MGAPGGQPAAIDLALVGAHGRNGSRAFSGAGPGSGANPRSQSALSGAPQPAQAATSTSPTPRSLPETRASPTPDGRPMPGPRARPARRPIPRTASTAAGGLPGSRGAGGPGSPAGPGCGRPDHRRGRPGRHRRVRRGTRARSAAPAQDGDLPTVIEEAVVPNEGIIDLNAPSPLATGEDLTLADMRNARDLAIYAGIAPSFDPLLLEAQETNPVFSTITSYNPEPFVPLGTRIGSFLLFTALQTDGDYNSNVFASPVALGDYALELWPSARLASNWANHAVEIRASGDLSFHDKFRRKMTAPTSSRRCPYRHHALQQHPGATSRTSWRRRPLGDQRHLDRHAPRRRRQPREPRRQPAVQPPQRAGARQRHRYALRQRHRRRRDREQLRSRLHAL